MTDDGPLMSATGWLADFAEREGRPLRVLHIGNIANNAYQCARIQRRYGIDADVVCYDYYHVMGCPEWHEATLNGTYDAFYPDWWSIDCGGWVRPSWFVQGPLHLCLEHLRAVRGGNLRHLQETRLALIQAYASLLDARAGLPLTRRRQVLDAQWRATTLRLAPELGQDGVEPLPSARTADAVQAQIDYRHARFRSAVRHYGDPAWRGAIIEQAVAGLVDPALRRRRDGQPLSPRERGAIAAYRLARRLTGRSGHPERTPSPVEQWTRDPASLGTPRLLARLAGGLAISTALRPLARRQRVEAPPVQSVTIGPETSVPPGNVLQRYRDQHHDIDPALVQGDLKHAAAVAAPWRDILSYYDVVQGYSTDGVIPLFAGHVKFTAYEHGTLRALPFEDSSRGRLCRFTYANAPRVLITNTDVLASADRVPVPVERRVYVPHAFDDAPLLAFKANHVRKRQDRVRLFSPSRHHWQTFDPNLSKGNDIFLRGAAGAMRTGCDFTITLVEWGQQIEASKRLIEDLGLGGRIDWVPIMGRTELWAAYLDAHAVVDQFSLPALGGIGFEALALGARLLTRLDEPALATFFGACPPAFVAATPDEVAERIREITADPDDLSRRGAGGAAWFAKYHSAARFLDLQIGAYRDLTLTDM